MKQRLSGKKIAILAAEGTHEHEFWVPFYRFKEEDADVIVCGFEKGAVYKGEGRKGKEGCDLAPVDEKIDEVKADNIDALIIPGGIFGPLALRRHEPTLELVREMDKQKKVIGAICHAQWVLVSADILKGVRSTSPDDMAVDMKNAGAVWVNEEAVRDGHIITSIYFGYLPAFMRLLIEAIEES
jgi:protease I